MVVNQGDIYWVALGGPSESEPGYTHPHVVIQDNVINRSRINTVVVCALTTNLKQAKSPGNVLLEAGEANLPKQSIVVISRVSTVDKAQLGEYIGSLTKQRIHQILAGMRFLQRMTDHRATGEESNGASEKASYTVSQALIAKSNSLAFLFGWLTQPSRLFYRYSLPAARGCILYRRRSLLTS